MSAAGDQKGPAAWRCLTMNSLCNFPGGPKINASQNIYIHFDGTAMSHCAQVASKLMSQALQGSWGKCMCLLQHATDKHKTAMGMPLLHDERSGTRRYDGPAGKSKQGGDGNPKAAQTSLEYNLTKAGRPATTTSCLGTHHANAINVTMYPHIHCLRRDATPS